MHFFYIDEAGCNGRDLCNVESPIFVLASLIVSDEKWNMTNKRFSEIISAYFDDVPDDFELHAEQLFSPTGDGPFRGHDRHRRNDLANQLLDLIEEKSHHTAYFAIDKSALQANLPPELGIKQYLDFSAPYLICFDYLLSLFEWYTKVRLGQSARAMIILDEKREFESEIRTIVRYQKYQVPETRRLKWIVEFSYPVSSHKNPMIQIADLLSYLIKKFLEIENGYRDGYAAQVKTVYRDFYSRIDSRLIRKQIIRADQRLCANDYYEFLNRIRALPSKHWKARVY